MNVLVIGFRQGLNRALERLGIDYKLVVENRVKFPPKNAQIFQVPGLAATPSQIKKIVNLIQNANIAPTHVIAATEAAVFPASYLRKELGCRLSPHSVIRRCTNKTDMKIFLRDQKIPMSKFFHSKNRPECSDLARELSFPIVVKDSNNSGGRGIRFINNIEELEKIEGKNLLFESFLAGEEGSIESFVSEQKILFSSTTEYFEKKHSNIVPSSYSDSIKEEILRLNEEVIKKLKINWGMTHLEYYITKDGLFFGEIALRPPGGYIMNLIELAYGFDPWEALVSVELGLEFNFPEKHQNFAGCFVHHPGIGVVKEIKPINSDSLVKNKMKVQVGDTISERNGVGEDMGYSLFQHQDIDSLKKDISAIRDESPIII